MEKNLIRLSSLTASRMFLNYYGKTEVLSVCEHLQKKQEPTSERKKTSKKCKQEP